VHTEVTENGPGTLKRPSNSGEKEPGEKASLERAQNLTRVGEKGLGTKFGEPLCKTGVWGKPIKKGLKMEIKRLKIRRTLLEIDPKEIGRIEGNFLESFKKQDMLTEVFKDIR